MKKAEFLALLRERLADFSNEDAEKSAAFYSEMIDDRMEEGMTEEEAVAALGNLDDIVRSIRQESHRDGENQRHTQRREEERTSEERPISGERSRHLSVAGIIGIIIGIIAILIAVTILLFTTVRRNGQGSTQNVSQSVQPVDGNSSAQQNPQQTGNSSAQSNSQQTGNSSTQQNQGTVSAGFTQQEYSLDMASVQQLYVSSLIDEIRIVPGDGTQLRAVYWQSSELWYETRQENGALYIEQKSSQEQISRRGRDDDDYKIWIYLPQGATALNVSTTGGEIEITNLNLPGTTILSSTNGDIDLKNCTGSDVQITSTTGDIDVEASVINNLQVNNTAGSIDLEMEAQAAAIVNASGEVEVKLLGSGADYTVQTQTTTGRAMAGSGTGSRVISITTESGKIEYEFIYGWD